MCNKKVLGSLLHLRCRCSTTQALQTLRGYGFPERNFSVLNLERASSFLQRSQTFFAILFPENFFQKFFYEKTILYRSFIVSPLGSQTPPSPFFVFGTLFQIYRPGTLFRFPPARPSLVGVLIVYVIYL
jgi:hypothetical protein